MHKLIILLLTFNVLAQDLPPAPRPKVNIILNKVDAKIIVDKARRMYPKLTKGYGRYEDKGAKIRFKIIESTDENITGCQLWESSPEVCLFNFYRYFKQHHPWLDGELYHLITPSILHNNKYYTGGAAFRNCYRWVKTDRNDYFNYTGASYSHFVLNQTDGETRFPDSLVALIHEIGHSVFGSKHDDIDSTTIMNTLFNVKRLSHTIPINKWRFSKYTKKRIHKCYRNPVLGGL